MSNGTDGVSFGPLHDLLNQLEEQMQNQAARMRDAGEPVDEKLITEILTQFETLRALTGPCEGSNMTRFFAPAP